MKQTIQELLQVQDKDIGWLNTALQSAVELEFSTIPPYLTAMWSIKDRKNDSYKIINSIVIQEMLHMGLACNMLATIGSTPQIDNPDFIPTYPGHLPGNVMPKLTVSLQGFSADAVKNTFMAIETPEHPVNVVPKEEDTALGAAPEAGGRRRMILEPPARADGSAAPTPPQNLSYPTIGLFYDAILAAFELQPSSIYTGKNQLVDDAWGLIAITNIEAVRTAITTIKEQGEGTSTSPYDMPDTTKPDDLAHYYKFGETYYGYTFVKQSGKWGWQGTPVKVPGSEEVYPVGMVPAGGYPDNQAVKDFDNLFSQLLVQLEAAWAEGSLDTLNNAISMMPRLTGSAVKIMQTKIPGTSPEQHYAPDFKYITQSK